MQEFEGSSERLSREEAEAILRRWASEQGSNAPETSGPTLAEIARVLHMSEDEVRLLRDRRTQAAPPILDPVAQPLDPQAQAFWRKRRTLDVLGAVLAAVAGIVILGFVFYMYRAGRNQPPANLVSDPISAPAPANAGPETAPIATLPAEAVAPAAPATPPAPSSIESSAGKTVISGPDGGKVEISEQGISIRDPDGKTTTVKIPQVEEVPAKGPEDPTPR